jgi:hypothetical protein
MTRMLTARNAVINTASVEVRTLSVEGRQVTLALFRQLIEQHIFDEGSGELRGIGWGHVRYLLADGTDHNKTINLVWQLGDELRRCVVRRNLGTGYSLDDPEAFLANPITPTDRYNEGKASPRDFRTPWRDFWVSDQTLQSFKAPHQYTYKEDEKEINARALEEYRKKVREYYLPIVREAVRIQRAYNNMIPPLFDLPQLFIAV